MTSTHAAVTARIHAAATTSTHAAVTTSTNATALISTSAAVSTGTLPAGAAEASAIFEQTVLSEQEMLINDMKEKKLDEGRAATMKQYVQPVYL